MALEADTLEASSDGEGRRAWQRYLADLREGNRLNAARIARLNGERAKLNEPEKTRSLARAFDTTGGARCVEARKG